MTLPVSPNSISLNQVNVELNRAGTLTLTLNDSIVRSLFEVASGTISMDNGRGKSDVFVFNLASGYSIDLRNAAIAAGWNGTSRVQATTSGNIGAINTSSYALIVAGSFPKGVTLINNHSIVGAGGNGGRCHYVSPDGVEFYGQLPPSGLDYLPRNGSAGGPGLNVTVALTLQNNGTIAGGGGGGGGGYNGDAPFGGSGGGGGAGLPAGQGGRALRYWYTAGGWAKSGGYIPDTWSDSHNTAGSAGTLTAGGAGGPGGYYGGYGDDRYGNHGGAGGGLGTSGGSNVSGRVGANPGGAAGAAIVGNGNITYTATGTRTGSIY